MTATQTKRSQEEEQELDEGQRTMLHGFGQRITELSDGHTENLAKQEKLRRGIRRHRATGRYLQGSAKTCHQTEGATLQSQLSDLIENHRLDLEGRADALGQHRRRLERGMEIPPRYTHAIISLEADVLPADAIKRLRA